MAYSYKASITVDNTKVSGSANITNFVMYGKSTYDGTDGEPDLRTTANGGHVQNTTTGGSTGSVTIPADLAFYSDSGLTTQLDHEIVEYDATTGAISFRVRIPTLLYGSDTTIYMGYGDSGVTTSQENVSGTWTDYAAVYHLNEASGTRYDATGNSNDTATENGVTTDTGCLYDTAIDFTLGDYLLVTNSNSLDITGAFTLITWAYNDVREDYMEYLTNYCDSGGTTGLDNLGIIFGVVNQSAHRRIRFGYKTNTSSWASGVHFWESAAASTAVSEWDFAAVSYTPGTTGSLVIRYNSTTPSGSWVIGDGTGTGINSLDQPLTIGARGVNASGPYDRMVGQLQELRIMAGQITGDHIDTIYANESSPSTFYTMGSEESVGATGISASKRSINC